MLRAISHDPDDVEWRAADPSPAPAQSTQNGSLTQETSNSKRKRQTGCFCAPQMFGGGIYLPDPTTYDPVEILLNTHDTKERNELTKLWRDNKLSELNFVGVVAALLAGVLTSTGSWPTILTNGRQSPWFVRTSWYCGIILSLMSIISAADQTVRLHRLSSHRNGLANTHKLLSKGSGTSKKTGRRTPSLFQIMTWQLPVMFLITATLCMIVGVFCLVWSATSSLTSLGKWDDQNKVAVVYTVVATIAILMFFAGQICLYSPIRE